MDRRFFLRLAAMTAATGLVNWRFAGAAPAPDSSLDCDVVVIGAGLGGLACGAYLAKAGFRTQVLEQHYRLGGYATNFTRQAGDRRFTCEVSLHSSALTTPDSKAMLDELGVWDRLEIVRHPHAWASRFPGFSLDIPSSAGLDGFEKMLRERFPAEAQGLARYFALWRGIMTETEALDRAPFKPEEFPKRFPNLWRIHDKTVAQVLDPEIRDPQLKAVLTQSCGYYGLPPSRLSAFFYLEPTGEYLQYGGCYLKGTSQSLSDALVKAITDKGGQVRPRTMVTAVLASGGRATGVRTADGKEIRCRAVVSNAAALELLRDLLPPDALPKDERARMEAMTPSPSSFMVWLGLDQDVTKTFPLPDASFYSGTDMEAAHAASMACDYERANIAMMLYDHLVPGFSPKGCSSVCLMGLSGYDHWKPFEADYLAGRKQAYQAEKKRLADILVRRCEQLAIPGLSKMIVMREASTPLTNLRFTKNPYGAIYGFAPTVDNAFMSRNPNTTGLKGLFLASAWGDPGGGFTGALLGGKGAFKDVAEFLGA
ncbi:FAD-dependent oxidoreductase [Desulfovibrio aminophilus]|uniref:phytoene desaturase family protein n=1 Tax=Desulfovibrio aminophilus TaxID=81425 RepID=UPI00339680DF